MLTPRYRVMKFGGSSVGAPERLKRVTDLIARERELTPVAVVVSAMGDTTDWLIEAANASAAGDFPAAEKQIERIAKLALDNGAGVLRLLSVDGDVAPIVGPLKDELHQILFGMSLLREKTPQSLDLVLSFGERISAAILAELLAARGFEATYIDARRWVVTDDRFGTATVDWPETKKKLQALKRTWGGAQALPVVTGFIGLTPDGRTTTLGRNGSDYTATLLSRALDAVEVNVWTDVKGVMTADPGLVAEAYSLARLSYMEAVELANYGTRMFHPRTMIPLIESGIPMRIRSTMAPDAPGTVIDALGAQDKERPTSVASLENLALIDIEWRRLSQPAQVGRRVLRALEKAECTVWMASQAAHGQAVAFVIPQKQVDAAQAAIRDELALELERREVQPLGLRAPVTLLSLVCETMGQTPNVAGRFFHSLGGVGVSIHAIAQGASSRSISCVIDAADTAVAVRTVHAAFNFAEQPVSVLVLGKGTVGGHLLDQLRDHQQTLSSDHGVAIRLVGVADSGRAAFSERGLDLGAWREALEAGQPVSVPALLERLRRLPVPVLVDCTAAGGMEAVYEAAFAHGVHVVAANKKPLTIAADDCERLMAAARKSHRAYLYETTVGASLPVIETLKNLVRTGDRVLLIEGSFSGTLGYLTNEVMKGASLSHAVRVAKDLGYTEPQPQDDLSGTDVARKALILARELGLKLSLEDIAVEPLVPAALLAEQDVEAFLRRLEGYDAEFEARVARGRAEGRTLRYLARIDPAATGPVVTVGPVSVPADHPATRLRGSEAFVAFTTERYHDYPLIVQGAGAGGAVTAAGVLADLLKIAQTLRGR